MIELAYKFQAIGFLCNPLGLRWQYLSLRAQVEFWQITRNLSSAKTLKGVKGMLAGTLAV